MKILMLCDFFNDNTEYQENLLAKYYIKHGHEVTIVSSTYISPFDYINDVSNSNLPEDTYVFNGYKVYKMRYSFNILNKLRKLSNVSNVLECEMPDLIFVHDIHLNLTDAIKYKKRLNKNCEIILDFHCDYSNSAKNWISLYILHKTIRGIFLKMNLRHIKKVFYITPSSGTFLSEVYNLASNKMELLPLGGDLDLAEKLRLQGCRREIREKYFIHDSDIVLFTGGRLNPKKKTEYLIEAFSKISNKNCYLFVVGDFDKNFPQYEEDLRNLFSSNLKIKFVGWQNKDDVYRFLVAADLAIFPASQSILWQQALVSGVPIIVGKDDIQDISYLNKFAAIETIELLDSNHDVLYNKILECIADSKKLESLKIMTQKTALEMLNYNILINQTLT
jgi:1,2-diacylglycerol 3-alpha-glucosyltransferase